MSLYSDYISYASSSETESQVGEVIYVLNTSSTSNVLSGYVRANDFYNQADYPELYSRVGLIRLYNDGVTWTERTTPVSGTTTQIYDFTYGNGVYLYCGSSGALGSSTDATTWTARTSGLNTSSNLFGLAYGNGVYALVGQSGIISSSTDGVTWTQRTSGTTAIFNDVTHANGLFVAVGVNVVRTSTDGETWTQRSSATSSAQYSVVYGNGIYVSVGINSSIHTSTNGITWTSQALGSTQDFTRVDYGSGIFVAVNESGVVRTSTNGATWTSLVTGLGILESVSYTNGLYVIGRSDGTILTSAPPYTSSTNYTSRTTGTSSTISALVLVEGNNIYLAGSYDGRIFTSTYNSPVYDFNAKFYVPSVTNTQDIIDESFGTYSTYTSSSYVAYVKATSTATKPIGSISKSFFYNQYLANAAPTIATDGISVKSGNNYSRTTYSTLFNQVGLLNAGILTPRTPGTSTPINAATYGNGIYVYAGNSGMIATSTNAITWTSRTSGSSTNFQALTYGNGTYVVAGGAGTILTSTNGVTWTVRTSGTVTVIYGLTYGNSLYLAGGSNGNLRSSTNGITWTARTPGTAGDSIYGFAHGIISGNSVYVYGGNAGALASSTNGITWTSRVAGISIDIFSVCYGNGLFVCGGNLGRMITSTNGTTWTTVTSGTSTRISTLGYGNSLYYYMDQLGSVGTSTNGTTWTTQTTGITSTAKDWVANAYGNGVYVLVDSLANLYTSTDMTNLQYSPTYDPTTNFYLPKLKAHTIETFTNKVNIQEVSYVRAI